MNASVRFIVFGTMPVGGFLGGVVGTWLGVVPALWIAVAVAFLAAVPVAASPLLRMRDLPDEWDAGRLPDAETAPAG
jgi:ABC-type lipoprotein release transport system permease subunit